MSITKNRGLVEEALKTSSLHRRYGNGTLAKFLEDTQHDDFIRWARLPDKRELRPDDSPEAPKRFAVACWELISAMTP